MSGKQEIRTDDAPAPGGSYSQGLVAGDFLYTAGMGPIDPRSGEVVGDDVATQTRQVLENLKAVLAAHQLTFDDVVKATVHLRELRRDFPAYDAVYRSHFMPPFPVRTTVGSDLMNILVEVDFVAYLGRLGWNPRFTLILRICAPRAPPRCWTGFSGTAVTA